MNCLFCPQELQRMPEGYLFHQIRMGCLTCKTKYYFESEWHPKNINRYMINYDDYILYFYINPIHFYLDKITNHRMINILHLDYLPNITPFNVAKKLPTLLTFL